MCHQGVTISRRGARSHCIAPALTQRRSRAEAKRTGLVIRWSSAPVFSSRRGRRLRILLGGTSLSRRRKTVHVKGAILHRFPIRIEKPERLLKDDGRRRIRRRGGVEDVKPVLVQIDADVAARSIWIRELQGMTHDELDEMKGVVGDFHAGFFTILRGGIRDRSRDIDQPVYTPPDPGGPPR